MLLTEELIRQKIKENNGKGIWIEGISNEAYHLGPGISSSDIKFLINNTIKKWLHKKENPEKPTRALILGTMIHTYILENHVFWSRYYREEETPTAPPRNTTVGKNAFSDWCALNHDIFISYGAKLESHEWQREYINHFFPEFRGKESVSISDMAMLEGIANSIANHPVLPKLISKDDCKSEISMYWIDPETDILCKCRPDINNFRWPCVLDIKSCQDAGLDKFEGDITERDMHVSAFWYLWGSSQVFEEKYDEFIYIPCEKEAPFEVSYYPADIGSLTLGEGLARAGLTIIKRYHDQLAKGITPYTGYSKENKPAGVRPFAFNKLSQVIYSHDLQNMNLEKFIQ